jgi:hypothetical protein
MTSPRYRTSRLLAVTAAVGLSAAGIQAANASTADEPPSTPVPVATPDGQLSSYVINAKSINPGQVRKIEKAVTKSGGVVVQSWPQIGVVIAHSTDADFRTAVVDAAGTAIHSVGPTRTAPVGEGTPDSVQTPWGPGKGQYKPEKKAADPVEAPTTVVDPPAEQYEALQWDMRMINVPQAHTVTTGSKQRHGRRPRQRNRPRPPGPEEPDRRQPVRQLQQRGPTGHLGHRLVAHGERPRHPRRRHHRAERNGVGIVGVARRADGLGQGRQRRRVHLPRVRDLRLHVGRREGHGGDEQQLLRRPLRVLVR